MLSQPVAARARTEREARSPAVCPRTVPRQNHVEALVRRCPDNGSSVQLLLDAIASESIRIEPPGGGGGGGGAALAHHDALWVASSLRSWQGSGKPLARPSVLRREWLSHSRFFERRLSEQPDTARDPTDALPRIVPGVRMLNPSAAEFRHGSCRRRRRGDLPRRNFSS